MRIGLDRVRHIEINDMRQTGHVNAPCGDIRRDQDVVGTLLETLERLLPLHL